MLTSTQNITSPDWSQIGFTDLRKKRLTIEFDASDVTVYINNSYKPPISWFLTNTTGDMILHGQIADRNYTIDLTELPKGVYSLRVAGEIHMIHNL